MTFSERFGKDFPIVQGPPKKLLLFSSIQRIKTSPRFNLVDPLYSTAGVRLSVNLVPNVFCLSSSTIIIYIRNIRDRQVCLLSLRLKTHFDPFFNDFTPTKSSDGFVLPALGGSLVHVASIIFSNPFNHGFLIKIAFKDEPREAAPV